jgi:protoporphyrinogen IX oxidase
MLWIKAIHLMAVVTWFAALFYLPRLFVYHAMANDEGDSRGSERFKVMERKLYRGIMMPSMVAATVLGLWLLHSYAWQVYSSMLWLHIKLLLALLLIGYHFWCGAMVKTFANDRNQRSHIFYRFFNELPVLLLIAMIALVIVKPV